MKHINVFDFLKMLGSGELQPEARIVLPEAKNRSLTVDAFSDQSDDWCCFQITNGCVEFYELYKGATEVSYILLE